MKISKYTYFILGFVAILGIIIISSQCSGSSTNSRGFCTDSSMLTMQLAEKEGSQSFPIFTLTTTYPKVPDKLGIYSLEKPVVSTDSTKRLFLSKLKNKIPAISTMPKVVDYTASYSMVTPKSFVSVFKNSGAETVVLDVSNLTASRKNGLPSEDKLKQSADAYVTENSILPQGYVYSGTSYITRQQVKEGGGLGAAEPITAMVKYGRTLEGLNIEGPGSSICVLEGEDGAILGYTKVSRNIGAEKAKVSVKAPGLQTVAAIGASKTKVSIKIPGQKTVVTKEPTFELLTPEEAFDMLQARGLTTEIANVTTATVDKMYLAYYESEPNEKQGDIEPIYVFQGTATGPMGSTQYTEYMYAEKVKNAKAPSQISDEIPNKDIIKKRTIQPPATQGLKDPELVKN